MQTIFAGNYYPIFKDVPKKIKAFSLPRCILHYHFINFKSYIPSASDHDGPPGIYGYSEGSVCWFC